MGGEERRVRKGMKLAEKMGGGREGARVTYLIINIMYHMCR